LKDGRLNEELHSRFSSWDKFLWYLSNHSNFYQSYQKENYTWNGHFYKIYDKYAVNFGKKDSSDWDMPIFLNEPFEEVKIAYQLYEELLDEFLKICQQKNITVLVGIIPTKFEFTGRFTTEEHSPGIPAHFLDSICAMKNIPFINLYKTMSAVTDDKMSYYNDWEFHFNAKGHRFTGKNMSLFFEDQYLRQDE